MADKNNFSSSNKNISIKGAAQKVNPKALLGGMTKDVKKRWMLVGTVSALSLVLVTTWMSSGKSAPPPVRKDENVVDTSPKGLTSQTDWKSQTSAEVMALKKSLDDSQASQKELMAQVEQLRQDMLKKQNTPATPAAGTSGLTPLLPPPPTPPASLLPQAPTPSAAPAGALPAGSAEPSKPFATQTVEPISPPKRSPAKSFIPPSGDGDASAQKDPVIDDMVPNEQSGLLPAGSFAAGTLISGVEAFTGGTAQQQPQPVVIRIDANAILPNAASYQVKGCHVLASVWGDMSAERVFGRLATLTCVDSANHLVLSEDVEGVLVDSDGKNGIRGKLEDRQGAKLARSLLAGFATGVSQAFGSAQTTTTQTAFGMTSALIGANAARAGAYSGASTAAQQLSDFYLKQAEATMPVIAVDAGRKISVLFTKSKSLKFETTNSYRVKPEDKLSVERPENH
jgi:conjugal transfer pilus assembly protein TraB